jgi:hypothetical protein
MVRGDSSCIWTKTPTGTLNETTQVSRNWVGRGGAQSPLLFRLRDYRVTGYLPPQSRADLMSKPGTRFFSSNDRRCRFAFVRAD